MPRPSGALKRGASAQAIPFPDLPELPKVRDAVEAARKAAKRAYDAGNKPRPRLSKGAKLGGYSMQGLIAGAGVVILAKLAEDFMGDYWPALLGNGWRLGQICGVVPFNVVDRRGPQHLADFCLILQPWDQLYGEPIPAGWEGMCIGDFHPSLAGRMIDGALYFRDVDADGSPAGVTPSAFPLPGAISRRPAQGFGVPIMQAIPVPLGVPFPQRLYPPVAGPLAPSEAPSRGYGVPAGSAARPGFNIGDIVFPARGGRVTTRVSSHTLAPASPGTQEQKVRIHSPRLFRAFLDILGQVSEGADLISALYEALPPERKRAHSLAGRATAVQRRFDEIDWRQAILNIVNQQIGDLTAAGPDKLTNEANAKLGELGLPSIPVGLGGFTPK